MAAASFAPPVLCTRFASTPIPATKQKKEKKTFTFSSLFLHRKPVIRRVFYFYRASGCLKSLKRFFTSCCFNQRHLNYRSFINPTLVFFERKSFFFAKIADIGARISSILRIQSLNAQKLRKICLLVKFAN